MHTVGEGTALDVFSGEPHVMAGLEETQEGQALGHGPVEGLSLHQLLALDQHSVYLRQVSIKLIAWISRLPFRKRNVFNGDRVDRIPTGPPQSISSSSSSSSCSSCPYPPAPPSSSSFCFRESFQLLLRLYLAFIAYVHRIHH
jgi:hypothetical protein